MQHQAIFETLFKRNFTDPGNKDFLEELTTAHPYFSPAQFFLLQQTEGNGPAFEKRVARTNILFNNPYWLHFQLQQAKQNGFSEEKKVAVTGPVQEYVPAIEKEAEPLRDEIPVIEEPTEPIIEDISIPIPGKEIESIKEDISVTEETIEPVIEDIRIPEKEIEPIREEMPVTEETIEPAKEELIFIEETTEPVKEDVPAVEKESELTTLSSDAQAEKKLPDEMPLFEPMHMVDYFASQGIKLSEEVQASDKLGKQLKSFTEWLKTMKKVHTETTTEAAANTDIVIQNLAEKSNKEDEVLTVSMADVFAKQGKVDKAIEVLQKLSLLNPSKSAYFAAKIEYLKGL